MITGYLCTSIVLDLLGWEVIVVKATESEVKMVWLQIWEREKVFYFISATQISQSQNLCALILIFRS